MHLWFSPMFEHIPVARLAMINGLIWCPAIKSHLIYRSYRILAWHQVSQDMLWIHHNPNQGKTLTEDEWPHESTKITVKPAWIEVKLMGTWINWYIDAIFIVPLPHATFLLSCFVITAGPVDFLCQDLLTPLYICALIFLIKMKLVCCGLKGQSLCECEFNEMTHIFKRSRSQKPSGNLTLHKMSLYNIFWVKIWKSLR